MNAVATVKKTDHAPRGVPVDEARAQDQPASEDQQLAELERTFSDRWEW